ncbi:iron-containing alcohol dehydrogenase [Myxococcota bacterium]|nr:iron-containing alcohol dehydrogenase [Myxococcota bacterium]MBU1432688.1 iron-containing alcohol dehydrogenase [Myxococcota bacterium]MBU1898011.1 iron-containing alcohol dehydrogenase [Myxococcota bacterium]
MYRAQHRVMKTVAVVLPIPTPELLTGAGCVLQLTEKIAARGLAHPLIVTDVMIRSLGLLDGLIDGLERAGLRYTIYDEVEANPTIESVEVGRNFYKKSGCDSIIAFGGGSPIDCAKIIGARVGNPYMPVRWMKGLFKVFLPIPPLFCAPTTAGTGSETTVVAVITNPNTHEKFAISDLKLVPKIAALDPALMTGLPPNLTATTGLDALTHAVEAYIGINGNDFTNQHAERAVRLIFEHLLSAYERGEEMEAREGMAQASYSAGLAFTRVYVGYVHAIAHSLGGLYGVPHGLANAIILPYVLDACREAAEEKLAALAVVAGLGEAREPPEGLAHRFIEGVRVLNQAMQIPEHVQALREEDIPLIVKRALREAHPDYPVPRIMTRAECEAVVRKLLPEER